MTYCYGCDQLRKAGISAKCIKHRDGEERLK